MTKQVTNILRTASVCMLATAFVLGSESIAAQSRPSTDAQLATITTDTGAFAPGHVSFVRYTAPGPCLQAALLAFHMSRRTLAVQDTFDATGRINASRDTLSPVVVKVAKTCGVRFRPETSKAEDLPDLFLLALLSQNDSLARHVLARQLTLAPNAATKDSLIGVAIAGYLAVRPAHLAAAETLLAEQDRRGASAIKVRISGRKQLLAAAVAAFDTGRVRYEAEQTIEALRSLDGRMAQHYEPELFGAYRQLAMLAFLHSPEDIQVVARRAKEDLSRLPPSPGGWVFSKLPLDSLAMLLSPVSNWTAVGHPTPSLRANVWFPARDSVQPRAGIVSLLIDLPKACYENDPSGFALWSHDCSTMIALIRRWRQQYSNTVLSMTLVTATTGISLLSGPQTTAEEAANLQWYVHDYLKLPMTIAVQAIPYDAPLPSPDGRRMVQQPYNQTDPFHQTYLRGSAVPESNIAVVLAGKNGVELYAGDSGPLIDYFLKQAVTP